MNALKRLSLVSVVLALSALLASAAQAELKIEITKGQGESVPIAVVPFAWEGDGANPYDVSSVIASDLSLSGRFAPVDPNKMLQKPAKAADIDFSDWRMLDTEVLVIGRVTQDGKDRYSIRYSVHDVYTGKELMRHRQTTNRASFRKNTHIVSDLIYEKLTGIPGVAATRIAYVNVTRKSGFKTYRLIVADADGENERTMLESRESILSPAWSPDGRKLAYVSFENGKSEVFVQELKTGARKRASARKGVNSAPVWSPDGKNLALTLSKGDGNLDIYLLDLAKQKPRRLTNWSSIETEANWAPASNMIYFTSDRSGGPQVYRVSPEGGKPERVTFEGGYNARPRISPDEKTVAVVHNDRGSYRIAVVDIERAYTQVLTSGTLDESPSFAPNGELLVYATRVGGKGILALVSADGRFEQKLAAVDGEIREPAWGPFPLRK